MSSDCPIDKETISTLSNEKRLISTYHELSGVEVVEKVRPSVTREGTPLQIMDRAGIDR